MDVDVVVEVVVLVDVEVDELVLVDVDVLVVDAVIVVVISQPWKPTSPFTLRYDSSISLNRAAVASHPACRVVSTPPKQPYCSSPVPANFSWARLSKAAVSAHSLAVSAYNKTSSPKSAPHFNSGVTGTGAVVVAAHALHAVRSSQQADPIPKHNSQSSRWFDSVSQVSTNSTSTSWSACAGRCSPHSPRATSCSASHRSNKWLIVTT